MLSRHHRNHIAGRNNIRTGAIALAIMAMLLPACTSNQPEATAPGAEGDVATNEPEAAAPGAESNVTTDEVADETAKLIGKPVTVRS